jgi:hypothetical protein
VASYLSPNLSFLLCKKGDILICLSRLLAGSISKINLSENNVIKKYKSLYL